VSPTTGEAILHTPRGTRLVIASIFALVVPAVLGAQARVIKVVSSDGRPIPFANVIVEGGVTQIADTSGMVSLGAGKHQTLTVNVRRIGFTPWFGKLVLPDTAAVLTVTLPQLTQSLSTVTVSGEQAIKSPLQLSGFYDRWLMRQKGVLSAVFIGPEELEFRHPDRITNMLYALNGVRITQACVQPPQRLSGGCVTGLVAFSTISTLKSGPCAMAIVVDGVQQYPLRGANVDLDMLLNASDVAAIEVYARGENMPVNFQFQDVGCGVLAFWTGTRKQ
jgi:hypothetical protein